MSNDNPSITIIMKFINQSTAEHITKCSEDTIKHFVVVVIPL